MEQQIPEALSELEDYVPISLWLRRDQLDRISNDAYNQSQTIYGFIRFIIDYYYDFINQSS